MIIRSIFILFLLFSIPLYARAEKLQAIKIIGNKRISTASIIEKLNIKINDKLTSRISEKAVQELYATKVFTHITADIRGNTLYVNVTESPVIEEIVFENNKKFKKPALLKIIDVKAREILTSEKVKSSIDKLTEFYNLNGVLKVVITPYIVKLPNNKVKLIFSFKNDAQRLKIKKISFLNNKRFASQELLKAIYSEEYRFYKIFNNKQYYYVANVLLDKELLRSFYLSRGFTDFVVDKVIFKNISDDEVIVIFILHEGKQYRFGRIAINNQLLRLQDKPLQSKELSRKIHTKTNDVFNITQVNRTVSDIAGLLNEKGYLFAKIGAAYKHNAQTIDITYNIEQGKKTFLNKIVITGNTRTLDRVIRRKLTLTEGGPYNLYKLAESKRNIRNLGFFKKIETEVSPSNDPEKVDLKVKVQEAQTGFINLGGGFSSATGIISSISLHENNLFGTGQALTATMQKSSKNFSGSIGIYDKGYFLNDEIRLGLQLFKYSYDRQKESSFSLRSTGTSVSMGYDITTKLSNTLRYTYKHNEVFDVRNTASQLIKEQEGVNNTSAIGYTLTYSTLDNYLAPTKGYVTTLSQDLAGIGGNVFFLKTESAIRYVVPILHSKATLQLSARGGYIQGYNDQSVKIAQRFFLGSKDIRGFDLAGIGPRDKKTGDALGGECYVISGAQVDFPLTNSKNLDLRGSFFVDAGTLSRISAKSPNILKSDLIRSSIGLGLVWKSPFGAMRLDFGFPMTSELYDKKKIVSFSIGKIF